MSDFGTVHYPPPALCCDHDEDAHIPDEHDSHFWTSHMGERWWCMGTYTPAVGAVPAAELEVPAHPALGASPSRVAPRITVNP